MKLKCSLVNIKNVARSLRFSFQFDIVDTIMSDFSSPIMMSRIRKNMQAYLGDIASLVPDHHSKASLVPDHHSKRTVYIL